MIFNINKPEFKRSIFTGKLSHIEEYERYSCVVSIPSLTSNIIQVCVFSFSLEQMWTPHLFSVAIEVPVTGQLDKANIRISFQNVSCSYNGNLIHPE